MSVVLKEVVQSAGSLKVCAGQDAGKESTIHSMTDLFESDNSAAITQTDATNAFRSLNREIFLHNINNICPEISNFLINCYRLPSRLFVRGKGELKSQRGTTQGHPIAIGLYPLGITPLTTAVTSSHLHNQCIIHLVSRFTILLL